MHFCKGAGFLKTGLFLFPGGEPAAVSGCIEGVAKRGDIGLDASGEKGCWILQKGEGADVGGFGADFFEPFDDFFGGHSLAKVEDEIGSWLFDPVEVADLFACGKAAGVGEDVGADGPLQPFSEL